MTMETATTVSTQQQLVVFNLEEETDGACIRTVGKIIRVQEVTSIPHAASHVEAGRSEGGVRGA